MSAPVYVDPLFVAISRDSQARRVGDRNGHRWCHMWSDDLDALHAMAARVGMKRQWFQNKPGFPHYDLVPGRRWLALRFGAVERDLMDYLREKKAKGVLA
jgi:hypothetical protein